VRWRATRRWRSALSKSTPPPGACAWTGARCLTATEFALLEHLARRPGVVLSRERLLEEVWDYADATGARTVDSHVAGLRRKLGPGVVRTVHGVGYALQERPTP
jgi:DNA-binding response OmpR family regulator